MLASYTSIICSSIQLVVLYIHACMMDIHGEVFCHCNTGAIGQSSSSNIRNEDYPANKYDSDSNFGCFVNLISAAASSSDGLLGVYLLLNEEER